MIFLPCKTTRHRVGQGQINVVPKDNHRSATVIVSRIGVKLAIEGPFEEMFRGGVLNTLRQVVGQAHSRKLVGRLNFLILGCDSEERRLLLNRRVYEVLVRRRCDIVQSPETVPQTGDVLFRELGALVEIARVDRLGIGTPVDTLQGRLHVRALANHLLLLRLQLLIDVIVKLLWAQEAGVEAILTRLSKPFVQRLEFF